MRIEALNRMLLPHLTVLFRIAARAAITCARRV